MKIAFLKSRKDLPGANELREKPNKSLSVFF